MTFILLFPLSCSWLHISVFYFPTIPLITYFTLVELFYHSRRVDIQSDVGFMSFTQTLTSVIGIARNLFVPFWYIFIPAIVWPSP